MRSGWQRILIPDETDVADDGLIDLVYPLYLMSKFLNILLDQNPQLRLEFYARIPKNDFSIFVLKS